MKVKSYAYAHLSKDRFDRWRRMIKEGLQLKNKAGPTLDSVIGHFSPPSHKAEYRLMKAGSTVFMSVTFWETGESAPLKKIKIKNASALTQLMRASTSGLVLISHLVPYAD